MVTIKSVLDHSIAFRVGIRSGDILLSLNSHEIHDVLDYRFYLAEEKVYIKIHRGPEIIDYVIQKEMYDDIGLEFETPLMDKKHRCENGCIFCFIDQLPKGLRESLYFKDDDSRLSFIHGNYITLTNLHDEDIQRLIDMHISPINISIHTMNPDLRVKMMKNKRSGEVLKYIQQIADAGLKIHAQIVLCKNVNDQEELSYTMQKMTEYYPSLESCSIVTSGLTKFREGLYPLEEFTPSDCEKIIDQVTSFGDICEKKYGSRIFYASDEIYVKCKREIPPFDFWGDFPQFENGVGMLASFKEEFTCALRLCESNDVIDERTISIATGECAYEFIKARCNEAMIKLPKLHIKVYSIKNNFFGGGVTVTGLLTGKDIYEQLVDKPLGERLFLCRTTINSSGELFLDGKTPDELSNELNIPISFVENDGGQFLDAIMGVSS